ncbi:MAG TPA: substrate-binding domain-containing protein [Hyphomicrobiaceae bacterium]|nr:substrate-binding domain-containing protein [Hyphomicrobiaceae bacterium]
MRRIAPSAVRRNALGATLGVLGMVCGSVSLAIAQGAVAQGHEGHRVDLVNRLSLRVCADPSNLPFSNEKGEGFENKIAEIVAAELKVPIEYVWYPMATGFIRNTLFAKRCDVVMGYAQGDELVLNTNHYYSSAYTLVYRAGHGLDGADSLADSRLKEKHIGIIAGTPPATTMAALGLIVNAKPYPLVVDTRYEAPAKRMIDDIRAGAIDAGVLWGPIAGYFAANGGETLNVVPLLKEKVGPRLTYRITFGVRQLEDDWKRQLNALISKLQGKFDTVLLQYHVPLLDEQNHLITTPRQ